ncbi:MAG: ABC transporter substrate-binding protein [Deltaproteobacteria bacterium]|jgi:glucose/mannose transport system substrate-binding protein|nr:ABC transporter substrate-binding protein [Deltaproteobacteria bacterium]
MLCNVKRIIVISVFAIAFVANATAGEVEVLHWWTSGGEAAAVQELQKMLQKEGHTWKDFAVAGGAGANAMTALKSRAVSGNPPTAAQVKGPQIQEWAQLGVLTNIDDVAQAEGWDTLVPRVVADIMKYEGHWVAVPVNVHRINWMWCNPAVFKKAGAQYPRTWDDFFAACDKIKQAGFIPVAFGGQPWQEATVWESIVAGVGGPGFYQQALVEADEQALASSTMVEALKIFKKIKPFTDKNAPGRDWNLATAMVIKGEAAMQFMGDWAKGEFTAAGKVPGKDYDALPAPGTMDVFLFNVDSFIMFEVKDPAAKAAQKAMARLILSPDFQVAFNVNKGSIPVRSGISEAPFDAVAVASMTAFEATASYGGLLPSMAHEMAVSPAVRGAMFDVITNFYNSDMPAADAAQKLAAAVREAKM